MAGEYHTEGMGMHLTQVATTYSMVSWKIIRRLYLSLKSNLAQKRPAKNIFFGSAGGMALYVLSVDTVSHGVLRKNYYTAQNADIKAQ
jgi:hypothetical protein